VLLNESAALFTLLSTTYVASKCRTLTAMYSLLDLLHSLSRPDLNTAPVFIADASSDLADIRVGLLAQSEGTVASLWQQLLLSAAADKISAFLFYSECPSERIHPEAPGAADNGSTMTPLLCQDKACLHGFAMILSQLARCAQKRKPPAASGASQLSLLIHNERISLNFVSAIHSIAMLVAASFLAQPAAQRHQQFPADVVAALNVAVANCEAAITDLLHVVDEQPQIRHSAKVIPDELSREPFFGGTTVTHRDSFDYSFRSDLDSSGGRDSGSSLLQRPVAADAEAPQDFNHRREKNAELQQCLCALNILRRQLALL
jgi:hypothetical protein